MADVHDVCSAIVALAGQSVYPNGTGQPSVANSDIRLYEGWPIPAQLDADLAAGKAHVSVFPRPEERRTTRYQPEWQTLSVNTPTLTAALVNQTVTIGGTVPDAQHPTNVSILANGKPYVYAVQATDTLTSIATALVTLMTTDIPGVSNTGPAINFPSSARIAAARVGIVGTLMREVRRQEKLFQVSVWAPDPDKRNAIAAAIDIPMAATEFLTMTDQTAARLLYKGTLVSDAHQKAGLYRRDLLYTVEYATTQVVTATQVTQQTINLIDGTTLNIDATINL